MTTLLLLKLAGLVCLIVFVVFTFDVRRKGDMKPLLDGRLILANKVGLGLGFGIFAYVVITLESALPTDYLAIGLAYAGTLIVIKAKRDLGKHHTWAGYCKQTSKLEVSGIYSYIRHPLYTGVHLFSLGELAMLIFHAPYYLTLIAVLMGGLMVTFLTFTASKETDYLSEKLGEQFLRYKEEVHPFLPLRKYLG